MPVREIKTTLKLDGEKEFEKAMKDASREMRVMNSDLRAIAAEYKATGEGANYFAQRSEKMADKVKQQEGMVTALKNAVEEAKEAFGDTAEKTDELRIKLSNATAKLFDMRREAEQAKREMEDFGRGSEKIGKQIENGIGDSAENAKEKLDGMFSRVSGDIADLRASVGFQTAMNVGEFVFEGIESVTSFVNENMEFNRQLAMARHNATKYNMNWNEVLELVVQATAVTGNQEAALEAASHLANAGISNEELMAAAMDAILGAYIRTGGALSLESLAEDLRASIVSKTPTGTYAEVLEEVLQGVVLEDVEKALQEAESIEEAFEIAVGVLTRGGLPTETKTFEEMNAELIEAQEKKVQLNLALARIAEELTPAVTTLTSNLIEAVEIVTDFIDWAKETSEKYGTSITGIADDALGKTIPGYNVAKNATTSVGIITDSEKREFAYQAFDQAYQEYFGKENPIEYIFKSIKDIFSGDAAERNQKEYLDSLGIGIPSAGAEEITAEGSAAADNFWAGFLAKVNESEYAETYLEALRTAIGTNAEEDAKTAGLNVSTLLGEGIAEGTPNAVEQARVLVSQLNSVFGTIAYPAFGGGVYYNYGGTGGGSIDITLEMDGEKVGRGSYNGVSSAANDATHATMLIK